MLFLRPIYEILGLGGGAARHSEGYKNLLKTKWMTLLGASLAVVSSTVFYINMGMFFVLGGDGKPFWANPYSHIFVFGVNLDSVLNDIGVLLVCGVLKKVDCSSLVRRAKATFGPSRYSVDPAPQAAIPSYVNASSASAS